MLNILGFAFHCLSKTIYDSIGHCYLLAEFQFDGPYPILQQDEVQQQFLQMNAVDRPVSRLSGILADGTT